MKTFLLVIVLSTPNVEQHIAIIMPNEQTCYTLRDSFVYSTVIYKTVEGDERMPIDIEEVRCEEHVDEERV